MPAGVTIPKRGATPGNPPAGTVLLYADGSADVHVRESDGTDTTLGAGGGAVSSVFGRTGAVVAAASDYDATQIDMSASSRILGRVTAGAGPVEELTGTQATGLLDAATTSARGIVELATSAETETGTDADRAVTPSGAAATYIKKSVGTTAGDILGFSGASTPVRLPGPSAANQVPLSSAAGVWTWVAATALAGGLILGDTWGSAEELVIDTDYSLVLT